MDDETTIELIDHRATAAGLLREAQGGSPDASITEVVAMAVIALGHATLAASAPDSDALRAAKREAEGERGVRTEVARRHNELRTAVRELVDYLLAATPGLAKHPAVTRVRDLVGGA